MKARVSKSEVEDFIKMVQSSITKRNYKFEERRKNLQSLMRHGLLIEDVLEEIYGLTYKDYISGPEDDYNDDFPYPVWKFKKNVVNEIFYIKIKIIKCEDEKLKILSFHLDNIIEN